jgi:hypothetical protein
MEAILLCMWYLVLVCGYTLTCAALLRLTWELF